MTRPDALKLVNKELDQLYWNNDIKPLNSHHEGYGVLLEEVDELWYEIKKKRDKRSLINVRNEAKQIAAVAIRIMMDLT